MRRMPTGRAASERLGGRPADQWWAMPINGYRRSYAAGPGAERLNMLIESLMNLALPSPNAKFAPPGWLLLALAKLEQGAQAAAQTTTVPGILPRVGCHDRVEQGPAAFTLGLDLACVLFEPRRVSRERAAGQNTLQDWRAWLTAVGFISRRITFRQWHCPAALPSRCPCK